MTIPHNRPFISEEDRTAVLRVLESNWIADGEEVEQLTAEFNTHMGNRGSSSMLNSGTSAIFIALKALQLPPGSFIAVPTYTCRALLDAVFLANLQPAIIDIKEDFTIDPASLEKFVTSTGDVKATIAVNTFGNIADSTALKKHGGHIIEDCCHSLGAKNTPVSDTIKIFSFYATKIITGGQGGAIYAENNTIIQSAIKYNEKNIRPGQYYEGFNFRLTDIQAALIRSQLKRIDTIFNTRSAIAKRYDAALPGALKLINPGFDSDKMYYRFVIYFDSPAQRDQAFSFFTNNNIGVSKLFRREELLHNAFAGHPAAYRADELAERILSIPIFPSLTEKELEHIERTLQKLL